MNEEGKNKLWAEYTETKSPQIRDKILIEYAELVKLVAGRLSMYLGHMVEYEDLIGYGTFGLIDAIDKFNSLKGVKFETYASLRIRGSILDQIRKMDWIPRTLRQKQKKLDAACQTFEAEHGRMGTEKEIADMLSLTVEELSEWQSQTKVTSLVSLDEFLEQGSEVRTEPMQSGQSHYDQPETVIEKEEIKQQLAQVIETLTENERKVILLYYYEEMTLKEISKVLNVSESRISQLHTKALQKMKVRLGDNIDFFRM